jgi:Zn-dependent peptidase ImmA (M78 family)
MFRRGFKSWAEEIAQRVRHKLGVPSVAPLDPCKLAGLLSVPILGPAEVRDLPEGVKQRLIREYSDNWSAITVTNGRHHLIVVNTGHPTTRRNSDLAHELAHLILGHEPSMMFLSPASGTALRTHNKEQEDEANWLAGCLLLPRDALLSIRGRRLADADACREYSISPAMLRFRLNASGVDIQMRRAKKWQR